jgi:hypothetical protein
MNNMRDEAHSFCIINRNKRVQLRLELIYNIPLCVVSKNARMFAKGGHVVPTLRF